MKKIKTAIFAGALAVAAMAVSVTPSSAAVVLGQ